MLHNKTTIAYASKALCKHEQGYVPDILETEVLFSQVPDYK